MKKWFSIILITVCLFSKLDAFTITVPDATRNAGVVVHEHSLDTYRCLLSCIDSAKYYVELSPCMTGGRLLKEMLEHLHQRMSVVPGLQAYLLIQPTLITGSDKVLLAGMQESWPDRFFYVFSDCPPSFNFLFPNVLESHIKLSVIDGKYIFIGGTNFEEFMCTPGDQVPTPSESDRLVIGGVQRPLAFRDQDITIISPELGLELRKEFHAHYAMWARFATSFWFNRNVEEFRGIGPLNLSLEEAQKVMNPALEQLKQVSVPLHKIACIFSGPDESPNSVTTTYEELIRGAKSSLHIASMYFVPVDSLFNSLIDAIHTRHISLELVTNGCNVNSPNITSTYGWGNRINFFPLLYGSRPFLWKKSQFARSEPNPFVCIYEFYVPNTQLHKKCMIVDEHILVIGSYNLGRKSDQCDYECVVVIDDAEVARQALQIFSKDKTLSIPVFSQEVFDWYFDPFYHLLGNAEVQFMPA